jgi:hypothetical protein
LALIVTQDRATAHLFFESHSHLPLDRDGVFQRMWI